VRSHYWWKGKIEKAKESLLICKTRSGLEEKIIKLVKENHSYEMPCINFLPIEKGNPDYLSWITEETSNI
jgi:periplasmic divalent cation tolerance protein